MPPNHTPDSVSNGLLLKDVALALRKRGGGARSLLTLPNLEVRAGSVTALMGSSGSGKTSLLHYISGVLSESFVAHGSVTLFGTNITTIPTQKRRIGLLWQDSLLFDHLTVAQNVGFAIPAHISKGERQERIDEALAVAELEDIAHAYPMNISKGQKSRTSVMRMLLADPQALLLDEPFANLDTSLRDNFGAFLLEHIRQRKIPALLVTHDPNDAKRMEAEIWTIHQCTLLRKQSPA